MTPPPSALHELLPAPACCDVERLRASVSSLAIAYREQEWRLNAAIDIASRVQSELTALRTEARSTRELEGFLSHARTVEAACEELRVAEQNSEEGGNGDGGGGDPRARSLRIMTATLGALRGAALSEAAVTIEQLRAERDALLLEREASFTVVAAMDGATREELERLNREVATCGTLAGVRERAGRAREAALQAEASELRNRVAELASALQEARRDGAGWQAAATEARRDHADLQRRFDGAASDAAAATALAVEVTRLRGQLAMRTAGGAAYR